MSAVDLIQELRSASRAWCNVPFSKLFGIAADALAAKDTALSEMRAELERARKALVAEQALSALQLKMLSEAYLEIDAYRAAARAASQDEGEAL